VAEGVSDVSKLRPSFITNDKELDLFLYQHNHNISWIGNIRGASAVLNLHNITKAPSTGMLVIDFDRDFKDDVLSISKVMKPLKGIL